MVARDLREGLSRLAPPLVLLAFCLPLFLGLGATDLENDEAIYSYAVESILTTGDWLGPRASPSPDDIFLEKPHLKLWLVAAPIRLGLLPLNEFGLRFWDALLGAVAFAYVFLIGRRLRGDAAGLVAVFVLFVHGPLIFDHGFRSNNMDAALVAAYCGGIYHYLRWASVAEGAGRTRHTAAVGAWFYLGFMSKFVAAVFLPAIVGICALLIPAHRVRLAADWRRWLTTALVVVAAMLPWFLYQHLRHGDAFWTILLGEHVVTRFTEYVDPEHVRPWNFYLAEAYRQFAASGSVLFVGAGLVLLGGAVIRGRSVEGLVVLAWAILPTAAISLGSSKLYHYFYPFLPPLALCAGYAAGLLWDGLYRVGSAGRAERIATAIPSGVRVAALVLAFVSLGVLIATGIAGTLRVPLGDDVVLRNSSLVRPAILAVACAALAVDVRFALAGILVWGLSLFTLTPFSVYGERLRMIGTERHPLKTLARCISAVDRSRATRGAAVGPYAPLADGYLHQYFYYFRGSGWLSGPPNPSAIRTALFVPGQERVVILEPAAYAAFLAQGGEDARLPAAIERPKIVVLLPGEYGNCRENRPSAGT